ncbi:MAG: hypothetical protein ACI9EF_000516 [Pseudohongiellaceae bacterium]|jgi:hypothetical protein
MHRSGTSAITRLLNLMGCSLGPEHAVAEPAHDNTAGFWERLDVRRTNDRLLAALGRSWLDCLEPDFEQLVPSEVKEFQWSARKILGELRSAGTWAVKDPRFCLTFPVWKPFLENPVCVFVHRDPLASALSLQQRNGLRLPVGLALWEHYNLSALRASTDLPRAIISYERFTREPEAATKELLEQLQQLGVKQLTLPSQKDLLTFVNPSLDHHGSGELLAEQQTPGDAILQLAASLRDRSALRTSAPALSEPSAALLTKLSGQWPGQTWITRLLRERDAQVAQLEQQLKEARGESS